MVRQSFHPGKECSEALNQLQEKQYVRNLKLEGFTNVLCYVAAFRGKCRLIRFMGDLKGDFEIFTNFSFDSVKALVK